MSALCRYDCENNLLLKEKMADTGRTETSPRKQLISASMKTEDLIHPHKASEIPGYNGHTPQLKFNCGHTYGYHTDKLTKKHMRNEKLVHNRPDEYIDLKKTYVSKHDGDKKYVEKMVPGYTGYVPVHRFKFGNTYKEGTEMAVVDFKRQDEKRKMEIADLNYKAATNPKHKLLATYPPSDISHPGTNLRYATAYYGKQFSDHRDFTESPIPGYTGYVPKREEHDLGLRYGTWSGKSYVDALTAKHNQEKSSTLPVTIGRLSLSTNGKGYTGHGAVYKSIGMVPKYTGYVPNRRFEIGNTYGDTTRLLPVCFDTPGYASAMYNHSGPAIKREVIPA
eukprot:gene5361-6032_t